MDWLLGSTLGRWVMKYPFKFIAIWLLVSIIALVTFMKLYEGVDIVSGIYFAIITGTTVGFGDISPKTDLGKLIVALYIVMSAFQFGGFIGMVSATATQLAAKRLRGLIAIKDDVYLTIAGYPEENKVRSIVRQIRLDSKRKNAMIVCLNNRLDSKPQWMDDDNVEFVRGVTSSKDALERANIYKTENMLVLANDPNEIASDEATSSVILMVESLHPSTRTVAESVRDEGELFDMCNCDRGVDVSNGKDLAHEILNPGAIDLVECLFSHDTPATQFNLTSTEERSWRKIVTLLLDKGGTALGFMPPDGENKKGSYTYAVNGGRSIPAGATIKYIASREIVL